jgi:hypothetical protein
LQLHTVKDTCWQLRKLLIYFLFVSLLPCNFDTNCHWYWTIIGRYHYNNLKSTQCCTSLQYITIAHSHLRCTSISQFHSFDIQIKNWKRDRNQEHLLLISVYKFLSSNTSCYILYEMVNMGHRIFLNYGV